MASGPISPAESTKKHPPPVQPNAHPYAIKTTSSALLSRSNSSPHTAHHTRHHYIPSPPSRIPTPATRGRHRYSSSLSSVEGGACGVHGVRTIPASLPTPPAVIPASSCNTCVSLKRADEAGPHRVCRAEAMPSSATEPIMESRSYDRKGGFSHDQDSTPELYAGLPPNPKQWNTDQLVSYLESSFGLGDTSGDKDDAGLADVLECVRARSFTGRELLRLTDADLVGTSLSDAQRARLLECSRILRAHVLRGRIYVDSYHSHEVSDNSNEIYSPSTRLSTPFHSIRGASVSADDLRLLETNSGEDESSLLPSPVISLHRSNSVSDASAQRYRDLARMRMRRRGRVKGLVETWERASTSGSECSTSEAESESETDPELESHSGSKASPQTPSDLPSTVLDEPICNTCSPLVGSAGLSQPPPPYTHIHSALGTAQVEEEEPSIEELLASSSETPLRGARAWEADFGLGETVKRVPVFAGADVGDATPGVVVAKLPLPQDDTQLSKSDSVRSNGSMRRGTGSRGKDANLKTRRRVVTAIFTGSPPSDTPENAGDKACLGSRPLDSICGQVAPVGSSIRHDPDGALQALEESITTTRAQLEAFRLRLEKVEVDTARQEAMFMHAQLSDSRYQENFELRHRRPEVNERLTTNTTEPTEREACVTSSRNGDAPDVWETISLTDIARAIVARTMKWLFPDHLGVHDEPRTQAGSRPGSDDDRSPAKKKGRFPVVRASCGIILVSFAICATVLRRMGFGRWIRRP